MSYKVDIHAAPKQLQEMMEKVLDTAVELSQRVQAVPAGALPAGPTGQTRYMEVTAVGTWTYGGTPVGSNEEGYRTTFWWNGTAWSNNGSVRVKGDTPTGSESLIDNEVPSGIAVKEYVESKTLEPDSLFTIEGKAIRSNNGTIIDATGENVITGYIDLDIATHITINGRSTSIVALVCFYDERKAFISSIGGDAYNSVKVVVNKEDFPVGAKYAILNGKNKTESYAIVSSLSDVYYTKKIATESNEYIEDFDSHSNELLVLDNDINLTGYYRLISGNRIFQNIADYKATPPTSIQLGDIFTTTSSIVSTDISASFHALFDENKNIIAPVISSSDISKYIITQDIIDSGAKFIAFSYRPTDVKSLTLFRKIRLDNLSERVYDLEKKVDQKDLSIGYISAMGASLMYSGNSWFERGCGIVGAIGYNKAESGVGTPPYFANKIWRGTYCTNEEFENIDILAIQFASSQNIDDTTGLQPTASSYTTSFDINDPTNPFESLTHAQCLDYILKYWRDRCYAQRENTGSKWFGTASGKPFRVVFVTHWHDARDYYNEAIRIVGKRWGITVCKFDEKIGFSKNTPLNGVQVSTLYAVDTQVVSGVTYGWHPQRVPEDNYIQVRMANIFSQCLVENYSSSLY